MENSRGRKLCALALKSDQMTKSVKQDMPGHQFYKDNTAMKIKENVVPAYIDEDKIAESHRPTSVTTKIDLHCGESSVSETNTANKLSCSSRVPGSSGEVHKSNTVTLPAEEYDSVSNIHDSSFVGLVIDISDPELRSLVESRSLINLFNSLEVKPNNQEVVKANACSVIITDSSQITSKLDFDPRETNEIKAIEIVTEDNCNIANIENDVTNNVEDFYDDANFNFENEQQLTEAEEVVHNNENQSENEHQLAGVEEVGQVHEENNEGRPKKGRKRKFQDQTRAIKKKRVNTNQDYTSTTGELKFCKEFRDYICDCRLKCNTRISVEKRRVVFTNFYKAGSFEARYQIIQGLVKIVPIKRKRVKDSEAKSVSRQYYLCDELVCKRMFEQTLRVSSCVIDNALKHKQNDTIVVDGRGRAGGHNKTPDEKIKLVIDHISKFPRYKSHYARSQSEANYLNPDITLNVMHNLYEEEHSEHPVSKATYKHIFLTKFNLKRKPLKKDTCLICDTAATQIKFLTGEQLEIIKSKHEDHIMMAEQARQLMKEHFKEAGEDLTKECLSFDLEKTLPLPRLPTNIVYYKRQLCFYNCGIHDSKNKGYCYTWVEGMAGRGAQEVGSCLRKHILEKVSPETKHLTLWSDSCGGQNRNIKMVLMLKSVLEEHTGLETITQHFLVPGHTFLKNDSDFSDIECALKLQSRLYVAEDYINIIKKCRKKNPLVVVKMDKYDFLGTDELQRSVTNRKVSTEGDKINWLHLRVIEVRKSSPMAFFVKKSLFEDNYTEVNILKKRGRRSSSENESTFFSSKLKMLWPEGKVISSKKLEDLRSMFNLIPKDCLPFYRSLVASNSVEDDIEGFDGDLDFEVE